MIVQSIQRNVVESCDFKSEIATIDAEEMRYVSSLLRNNYSNPILATVRETFANAVDANIGSSFPIEIQLPTSIEPTFKVRDSGSGLSEEELFGLYTKYGRSTKRHDNSSIGGFGIGRFAPLSYTDSFTVISRRNGSKIIISVYVDEHGDTRFTKMNEEATTERNGLEIEVSVKRHDIDAFHSSFHKVSTFSDAKIEGNFERASTEWLCEGKNWAIFSKSDSHYHPCNNSDNSSPIVVMGGISYPVNLHQVCSNTAVEWKQMRNLANYTNLVMFLPVGSVSLHHSREHLEYNQRTKTFLYNFISGVLKDFNSVIQQKLDSFQNFKDFAVAFHNLSEDYFAGFVADSKFIFTSSSGEKASTCPTVLMDDYISMFVRKNNEARSKKKNKISPAVLYSQENLALLVADCKGYSGCANWIIRNNPKIESVYVVSPETAKEKFFVQHACCDRVFFTSKTPKISFGRIAQKGSAVLLLRQKDNSDEYEREGNKIDLPTDEFYYVLIRKPNPRTHFSRQSYYIGRQEFSVKNTYRVYSFLQILNKMGSNVKKFCGVYNTSDLPPYAKSLEAEIKKVGETLLHKHKNLINSEKISAVYSSFVSSKLLMEKMREKLGEDHVISKFFAKSLGNACHKEHLSTDEKKEVDFVEMVIDLNIISNDIFHDETSTAKHEFAQLVEKYPLVFDLVNQLNFWYTDDRTTKNIDAFVSYVHLVDKKS